MLPYKVKYPTYSKWTKLVGAIIEIFEGLTSLLIIPFGFEVDWTLHWTGWILRTQHIPEPTLKTSKEG